MTVGAQCITKKNVSNEQEPHLHNYPQQPTVLLTRFASQYYYSGIFWKHRLSFVYYTAKLDLIFYVINKHNLCNFEQFKWSRILHIAHMTAMFIFFPIWVNN